MEESYTQTLADQERYRRDCARKEALWRSGFFLSLAGAAACAVAARLSKARAAIIA